MKLDAIRHIVVPPSLAGSRLDQALSELFPEYSRSRLQAWIKSNQVSVNGANLRARDKVMGGEVIDLQPEVEPDARVLAQAIDLSIVYQDAALIVVNKPPGLVVHPAAGNRDGTLQNALLHHDPNLAILPRGGLVHRLDKDTSGLLVVARTLESHTALVLQLQDRAFEREYLALVQGEVTAGGTVDAPLARHPVDRKRYAVRDHGKWAVTHYRIERRMPRYTLLRVKLETGRTHQIRVHMAHIRHPIVGDPIYGGRLKIPAGASEGVKEALRQFRRQALHATRLGLTHPESGEFMNWEVPMPDDMQHLLQQLSEQ